MSSTSLKNIKEVDIDGEGIFKYILIRVYGPEKGVEPAKIIVRGYKHCPYHGDIYDEVTAKELTPNNLDSECLGGGRIEHAPAEKKIKVYGYSQGFGRADHAVSVELLKKFYGDYSITWSNEVLDSSTKLPDGILAGNTFQMGHFDECLSVGVVLPGEERKLRGQYCLAEIEYSPKNLDEYSNSYESNEIDLFNTSVWVHIKSFSLDRTKTRRDAIYWAICIPDSCRPKDLKTAMEETMNAQEISRNINVNIKVNEKFCQVASDRSDWSWIGIPQLVMGFVIGFFVIMVTASTFYDILVIREENKLKGLSKFLSCFSAKKNFQNLRHVDKNKDIIPIHTTRFMSMIVILMGHRFIANSGAPIHNAIFMENAVENPLFIHLLMGPVLVVDTFFLLSGFLTGYQMFKDFDMKRFKLISGYVHRYIRLTPVYILVVGFYATILFHLGSGPLWKARVSLEQDRCSRNWWTNLLYVNNYVNTEDLCMFQSWHLTCDFHFYLMAPPIVYLLWKKALLGFSFVVVLIASVAGILFALTYKYHLDPVLMSFNSVLVDLNSDPTFRITYIPTHTRFIPYLIGLVASYIYYKKKLHVQLSNRNRAFLSISIILLSHVPVFGAISFYTAGFEYDRILAAVYASLHRIPWSIAMACLILTAATKNGGLLQPLMSWRAFVPLSRLTYCVFLSHGAVQLYSSSSLRTPDYNSKFKILWTLMGDILITYIISLGMHLALEAPILRLDRAYFTSSHKSSDDKPKTNLQMNGKENKGFSADSLTNLQIISNDKNQFTVTGPHQKYSQNYERYLRRMSENCREDVAEIR